MPSSKLSKFLFILTVIPVFSELIATIVKQWGDSQNKGTIPPPLNERAVSQGRGEEEDDKGP